MIRTQTEIFCQRMRLEIQCLCEYAALLERWNEDDEQDEVMLEAELDMVYRIGDAIKEMSGLQSAQWSAVYKTLEATAEKAAPVIEAKEVEDNESLQPGL